MKSPLEPLRILLVEDSRDDADLILFALNEGGLAAIHARVETETEMRTAMADGHWDVVISDFNLPTFNASRAMAVLRETDSDIPFVIVSGCIGEESVVALMKQGVSDFVMKDKLARLAPVIEQELRLMAMQKDHRLAQEALLANEKLLQKITSALGEGVLVLDDKGRLLFMNPEAERLLGWTQRELQGWDMYRIIHSQKMDDTPVPELSGEMHGLFQGAGVFRTEENVFWRKDGSLMNVSIVASAIEEEGKAIAAVVVFQDISQRKQAEWELLESRKQLRELTSYLQTVREEERTRIARELHDEFGQMLTGIKLDVIWLASRLSVEQPTITGKIASMSRMIDDTLDAMRRVAADLRPVMLDDLGLMAAVEWLTEDFAKRTGIDVHLEVKDGQLQNGCDGCSCNRVICDMNADMATAVFRIMQECLTNVVRHAEATYVLVKLQCQDGKLLLEVSDNGKGMASGNETKRNAFGIMGMRERARGLGGMLNFSSVAGEGTSVELVVPIEFAQREFTAGMEAKP